MLLSVVVKMLVMSLPRLHVTVNSMLDFSICSLKKNSVESKVISVQSILLLFIPMENPTAQVIIVLLLLLITKSTFQALKMVSFVHINLIAITCHTRTN